MLAPDPSAWFTSFDLDPDEDSNSTISEVSDEVPWGEPEGPLPPNPFPWGLLVVNLLFFAFGMSTPYMTLESILSFANSFWFWSSPLSLVAAAAWAYFGFPSPFLPGGNQREADKAFLVTQLKRHSKQGRPIGPSIRTHGFHKSYPRKLHSQGQFVGKPPSIFEHNVLVALEQLHTKVDELTRSLNTVRRPVPSSFIGHPSPTFGNHRFNLLKQRKAKMAKAKTWKGKKDKVNLKKSPTCPYGHYWDKGEQCFLPKKAPP